MKTIFCIKLIFCFTVFLFCAKSKGQQLVGHILLQNSSKKPVDGVQIKSDGANPDISHQDGGFQLRYINRSGGSTVSLILEKANLEVVNEKDIAGHRLRNNYAEDPFYIFMCPKGELARRRADYYDINEKNINKRYEEELAKLQRQNKNTRDALAELDDKRKAALAQATPLAERLAITNLDFCTDIYRQAIAFVEQGNIAAALNLLDDTILRGNMTKVEKELADAQILKEQSTAKRNTALKNKKQAIDNLMLKADLYSVNLQFDEAERVYRRAIGADSSNYENISTFAVFLMDQNKHEEAIIFNGKVFTIAPDGEYKMSSLSNQALSYGYQKNYPKQEELLKKVLNYLQNIPNLKEKYLSSIKINMGHHYSSKLDYTTAQKWFEEALNEIEASNSQKEEDKLLIITLLKGNIAGIKQTLGNYQEAEKLYLEAWENAKKLGLLNPKKHGDSQIMYLLNLGGLYSDLNRNEEAENYYLKAYELDKNLAGKNPLKFEPNLALVTNNLGHLYIEMGAYDKAEKYCTETLNLGNRLSQRNPKAYTYIIAMANQNLGNAYDMLKQYNKAQLAFEDAITKRKEAAQYDPQSNLISLALCYNDAGNHYSSIKLLSESEQYYLNALNIFDNYAKKYNLFFYYYQSLSYYNLANVHLELKIYDKSESNFIKSIEALNNIIKDSPVRYEPFMAKIEDKFAGLFWNQGDIGKAAPHFTNALNIYRKYGKKDAKTYNYPNALACINLARIHKYIYENKGHNPVSKNYALSLVEEALDRLKTYPANRTEVKDLLEFCTNLKKDLTNK